MSTGAAPPIASRISRVDPSAVLAVVAVAQFMVILDASIVNVSLPTIKRDLGISQANLAWILNAYTLMFGGFLLLGGRLADQLGRRRMFMVGIAVFSGASLVCGISQSEGTLLVARGLQGLGGAMLSPAALSIILTTFAEGTRRNHALSVWAAVAGAGGAVGLLFGGVIVDVLGWRWVFFVNVPVGATMLALTPRIVPESRTEAAAKRGYDVEGAVTITLGTLALVFTLMNADRWGWTSGRAIAGFVIAAGADRCVSEDRAPPSRIRWSRCGSSRTAALPPRTRRCSLMAAALFGIYFFVTLYLQQVLGFSASKTGVAFLPLSLTIIGASAVASRLVDRFTPKPVLLGGLLITIAGFVVLATLSGHGDYGSRVVPAMILLGVGPGISFVPITIAGTSGVAQEDCGLASGLLNTTQQIGGALGLAILSTVAAHRTTSALHAGSTQSAALTHGFTGAFFVSGVLIAVGGVLSIALLPGRRHERPHEHVKTVALSIARFPGAPHWGHHARVVVLRPSSP